MSPLGRYSRLAQGASPGLGIDIHFLSPQRGRHFQDIRQMRAPKVPLLRSSYFLSMFTQGSVRAFGTLATLGYAGVSCLRHS